MGVECATKNTRSRMLGVLEGGVDANSAEAEAGEDANEVSSHFFLLFWIACVAPSPLLLDSIWAMQQL